MGVYERVEIYMPKYAESDKGCNHKNFSEVDFLDFDLWHLSML